MPVLLLRGTGRIAEWAGPWPSGPIGAGTWDSQGPLPGEDGPLQCLCAEGLRLYPKTLHSYYNTRDLTGAPHPAPRPL